LTLNNGKSLIWKPPQLLIQSDASKEAKEGWGGGLVIKGKEWVENSEQHPHSDGQHGGSVYLVKWGSSGSKQTNMEICY